jgi:hypothetical protein
MTIEQISQLHSGDEVCFTDPCNGSVRILEIQNVQILENIIVITELDGSTLECFATELS